MAAWHSVGWAIFLFVGKVMLALAGCQGVMALGALAVGMWLYYVGIGLSLAVVFGAVIHANTGNRFQKKSK